MTFKAESFWSGNYIITIIQKFILVSLTSIVIPDPVGLLFRAAVSSHRTHLTLSALNSLRTWLPMHTTPYTFNFLYTSLPTHLTPHCLRLYNSQKNIPLRYLFEIVHLSRYAVVILNRCSKWQGSWIVG